MREIFKNLGFTMAEAILVMTILGIIATIMITTMKPAQFKEKGYQILAKQTLADLDTALGMILTNHCPYGTLDACYRLGTTEIFDLRDKYTSPTYFINAEYFSDLLKKYLATSRRTPTLPCVAFDGSSLVTTNKQCFYLKNGTYVLITLDGTAGGQSWIPGEKEATDDSETADLQYAAIWIDINADEEPNVLGKDRYAIPLDKYGIMGGN